VIDDVANGVASATSRARVATSLIVARLVLRAIRTDHALGSAGWWCSDKSAYATAYHLIVILPTLTVRTAGRWVTGISNGGHYNTIEDRIGFTYGNASEGRKSQRGAPNAPLITQRNTLNGRTQDEGITVHPGRATAHWHVVVYIAHGILPTNAWTGIYAFVPHACQRIGAIVIQHAFRPTAAVRIPEIFRYASASSSVALCVRPTRTWHARIRLNWHDDGCNDTSCEKRWNA